jgi:L-ribulose-5-phosphate 3-epimerase
MSHHDNGAGEQHRPDRRRFLAKIGLGAAAIGLASSSPIQARPRQETTSASSDRAVRPNPIGVSTYSFWQFREGARRITIPECIDKAAAMGFDGVEILHVQMEDESNRALQKIKRHAHSLGLALMGFSTHQGFVSPDRQERHANVQKTLYQIDVAYRLGIPTMRINTGRWGTIKSFDDFMVKKGIEPALAGHTEEEAFRWVIDSL